MKKSLHSAEGQLLMWHRRAQKFTRERLGLETFRAKYVMCKKGDMLANYVYVGMPIHYVHWSHGKRYQLLRNDPQTMQSLAYEMVINSDPSYVYHLDDNDAPLNAMICPHVQGHIWFFENNALFANTNPKGLMDRLRAGRDRIDSYRRNPAIGDKKVDEAIEAALALDDHVGGILPQASTTSDAEERSRLEGRLDDLKFQIPRESSEFKKRQLVEEKEQLEAQLGRRPLSPSDDLLAFLIDKENNPGLADWVREIFSIVRQDSLYFKPQKWTKNMNEGFATFVHLNAINQPEWAMASTKYVPRLARLNASFEMGMSHTYFVPYSLFYKIFRDIYQKTRRSDHEPMLEYDMEDLEHEEVPAPGEAYFLFPTGTSTKVQVPSMDVEGVKDAAKLYDDANFFRTFMSEELFGAINSEQLVKVRDYMMSVNIAISRSGFARELIVNPLPTKIEELMDVIERWSNEYEASVAAHKQIGTPIFPIYPEQLQDAGTALQVMGAFEANKDVCKRQLLVRNVPSLRTPKVWVVDASDGVLTLVHDYERVFGKLHEQEAKDVLRYMKSNWGGTSIKLLTKKRKKGAAKDDPAYTYEYFCNEKGEVSERFVD